MAVIDSRLRNYVPTSGTPRVITQSQALDPIKSPFLTGLNMKPKKPGGWKGFMASVFENPLLKFGVLKPLEVLDTGRRAIISGVREVADALDSDPNTKASFSDWAKQTRDTSYGFGKAFPMKGWLGRVVGFVGDVGLDPLTYVSFGGNQALKGVEGGEKAIHIASEAGRRELAQRVYKITVAAGEDAAVAGRRAARVAQEGVSAARKVLTVEQQAEAGLAKAGAYFFGKRIKAVRVPLSGVVGEMVEGASSRMRLLAASTKPGGWLQKVTMPGELKELRLQLARGEVPADQVFQKLASFGALDRMKAEVASASERIRGYADVALRDSGLANDAENRKILHRLIEEPALLEQASPAMQQAAKAWKGFFDNAYAEMRATLEKVDPEAIFKHHDNYMPHLLTEQAREFLTGGSPLAQRIRKELAVDFDNPESFLHPRRLEAGKKFFGEDELKIGDLTIGRLNKMANDGGFVGDFFETDLAKLVDNYSQQWSRQHGVAAFHKHMLDEGVYKLTDSVLEHDAGVVAQAAKGRAMEAEAFVKTQENAIELARQAAKATQDHAAVLQETLAATVDKRLGMATERVAKVDAAVAEMHRTREALRQARSAVAEQQVFVDMLDEQGSLVKHLFADAHAKTMEDLDQLISSIDSQLSMATATAADAAERVAAGQKLIKDFEAEAANRIRNQNEALRMQAWIGQHLADIADPAKELRVPVSEWEPQIKFLREAINPAVERAANQAGKGAAIPGSTEMWFYDAVRNGLKDGATGVDKEVADLFGPTVKLGGLKRLSNTKSMEAFNAALTVGHDMGESAHAAALDLARTLKFFGGEANIPSQLREYYDAAKAGLQRMRELESFNHMVSLAPARQPEWYAERISALRNVLPEMAEAFEDTVGLIGHAENLKQARFDLYHEMQLAHEDGRFIEAALYRDQFETMSTELASVNKQITSNTERTFVLKEGGEASVGEMLEQEFLSTSYAEQFSSQRLARDAANGWVSDAALEQRLRHLDDLRARQAKLQELRDARPAVEADQTLQLSDMPEAADSLTKLETQQDRALAASAQNAPKTTDGAVTQRLGTSAIDNSKGKTFTRTVNGRVRVTGAAAEDERRAAMLAAEEHLMARQVSQEWVLLTEKLSYVGMEPSEQMLDLIVNKVRIKRTAIWDAEVARTLERSHSLDAQLKKVEATLAGLDLENVTAQQWRKLASDAIESMGGDANAYATKVLTRDREIMNQARLAGAGPERDALMKERAALWNEVNDWYKRTHPSEKFQNGRVGQKRLRAAIQAQGVDVSSAKRWEEFRSRLTGEATDDAAHAMKSRRRIAVNLGDPDASGQLVMENGFGTFQNTPTVRLAAREAQVKYLEDLTLRQKAAADEVVKAAQKLRRPAEQLAARVKKQSEATWKQVESIADRVAAMKADPLYLAEQRRLDLSRVVSSLANADGWKLTHEDWHALGLAPLPPVDPQSAKQLAQLIETAKAEGKQLFVKDGSRKGGYRRITEPSHVRPGEEVLVRLQSERWEPLQTLDAPVPAPSVMGEQAAVVSPVTVTRPPKEAFESFDPHEADRAFLRDKVARIDERVAQAETALAQASTPRMMAAQNRISAIEHEIGQLSGYTSGAADPSTFMQWTPDVGWERPGTSSREAAQARIAKLKEERLQAISEYNKAARQANASKLVSDAEKVRRVREVFASQWERQADELPMSERLVDPNYRTAYLRDANGRATKVQGYERKVLDEEFAPVFTHGQRTNDLSFSEAEWESLFLNPKERGSQAKWQSRIQTEERKLAALRREADAAASVGEVDVESRSWREVAAHQRVRDQEDLVNRLRKMAESRTPEVADGAWKKVEQMYSSIVRLFGYDPNGWPDMGHLLEMGVGEQHVTMSAEHVASRMQSLEASMAGSKAHAYSAEISKLEGKMEGLLGQRTIGDRDAAQQLANARVAENAAKESAVPKLASEMKKLATGLSDSLKDADLSTMPTLTGDHVADAAAIEQWVGTVQKELGTALNEGRADAKRIAKQVGKNGRSAAPGYVKEPLVKGADGVLTDAVGQARQELGAANATVKKLQADLSEAWKMVDRETKAGEKAVAAAEKAHSKLVDSELKKMSKLELEQKAAEEAHARAVQAFDQANAVSADVAASKLREQKLRETIAFIEERNNRVLGQQADLVGVGPADRKAIEEGKRAEKTLADGFRKTKKGAKRELADADRAKLEQVAEAGRQAAESAKGRRGSDLAALSLNRTYEDLLSVRGQAVDSGALEARIKAGQEAERRLAEADAAATAAAPVQVPAPASAAPQGSADTVAGQIQGDFATIGGGITDAVKQTFQRNDELKNMLHSYASAKGLDPAGVDIMKYGPDRMRFKYGGKTYEVPISTLEKEAGVGSARPTLAAAGTQVRAQGQLAVDNSMTLSQAQREAFQRAVEDGRRAAEELAAAAPTAGPIDDALRATLEASLNAEAELYRSGQALKASEEALYDAHYLSQRLVPMVREGFESLRSWGLPSLETNVFVKEMFDNMARVEQPVVAKELSKLLGWYTKRFKAYSTASPGFHIRNALSNTFSVFAAGGDIANMGTAEKLFQGWYSARAAGTIEDFMATLGERKPLFDEALRIYHAAGGGQQVSAMEGLLKDGKNVIDNNIWLRANRKMAERVEGSARFMLAYDSVVKGMGFDGGLARVRRYLFDYTPAMRSTLDETMAQVVPFWTWMSRNLPLQLVNRWTNPRAYAIYNSLMRNIAHGDNSGAPEWAQQQGAVSLGGGNFLMPDVGFNRVNEQLQMLGDPMRMLSDVNPLLRVPIELAGNRRFYNDSQFSQRPQEVVGGPLSPAVSALLGLLGQTGQVTQGGQGMPIGTTTTSDKANYALMNTLPPLAMLERLFPNTGQYQERQGNSWNGFMGLPLRSFPGNN